MKQKPLYLRLPFDLKAEVEVKSKSLNMSYSRFINLAIIFALQNFDDFKQSLMTLQENYARRKNHDEL